MKSNMYSQQVPQQNQIPFWKKHTTFWICILCMLLSFLVYGNTLGGQFVYDDASYSKRTEFHSAQHLIDVWRTTTFQNTTITTGFRPLVVFTWTLTFVLFGDSPFPFHLTNVIVHGLNTFLVYVLLLKLTKSRGVSLVSAVIFGVLPIHTESVANIKGRDDLLSTLFSLTSFLSLMAAERKSSRLKFLWYGLSIVFFLCAMLSKELVVIMPALYLLWYMTSGKRSWRKVTLLALGYGLVVGVYFFWRYLTFGNAHAIDVNFADYLYNPLTSANGWVRLFTNLKLIALYLEKTFVPIHLSAGYQYNQIPLESGLSSWSTLFGVLVCGIVLFILLKRSQWATPLWWGVALFAVPMLMVLKIFFQAADMFAERWMYFPSIGLSVLAALGLLAVHRVNRQLGMICIMAICILYGLRTIHRNTVWSSNTRLFQSMVRDAPMSSHAHYLLGYELYIADALDAAERELTQSLMIYPGNRYPYPLMGLLRMKQGEYAEAEKLLAPYVSDREVIDGVQLAYGYVLSKQGKYTACIEYLERQHDTHPDKWQFQFLYGVCLYQAGRSEEAGQFVSYDAKTHEFRSKHEAAKGKSSYTIDNGATIID